MSTNYSKFLTKLTTTVGLVCISILTTLQSGAKEVANPRPDIFNKPPYTRNTIRNEPPLQPDRETSTPALAPATPLAGANDSRSVAALIASNNSFKTLDKALKAAGLTETLQGKGPFTVFAPTDDAFAKLPQDALRDLLKPENKEVLIKVLTYHVVSGKTLSTDFKSGEVKSLQGDPINVNVTPDSGVQVNDAKVIKTDIKVGNGVIHAIDNLILPPSL